MKINIIVENGQIVAKWLGDIPKKLTPALAQVLNVYVMKLAEHIRFQKLSGQVLKTGNPPRLRESILPIFAKQEGDGRIWAGIGTNVIYARIHEFGGIITPKTAGALTIPFPGIKGKAKDYQNTWLYRRSGKNPVIMQRLSSPKGRKTSYRPLFTLVKSVRIPARPYIRPSFEETENLLVAGLEKAINESLNKD
jgi:phage gpG-like protein